MKTFITLLFCFYTFTASAQLSNSQILEIKETSDDGKSLWMKYFEEGYAKKNMADLPPLRKTNEEYLSQNISKLGRLLAEGDGRDLLTAVRNYLQIQKQFVRDVMIPAESLKPNDAEGYYELNKKIADFSQKEKPFLLDISNAVRSSPEPMAAEPQEAEEAEEPELSEEEIKKREEAKPRRKGKLPHEDYDDKKKKGKNKDDDGDE